MIGHFFHKFIADGITQRISRRKRSKNSKKAALTALVSANPLTVAEFLDHSFIHWEDLHPSKYPLRIEIAANTAALTMLRLNRILTMNGTRPLKNCHRLYSMHSNKKSANLIRGLSDFVLILTSSCTLNVVSMPHLFL